MSRAVQMSTQGITSNVVVDLRSDTITLPSAAMRQRMMTTSVGDDVFGEDPTINELEARVAGLFGKESSLFFPSGTMSNLAAVMSWCGTRGSEMILGDTSHIHLFEQAGTAQIAGVGSRTIPNKRDGTMNLEAVEAAIRTDNVHFPVTELIAIENTHNFCGGRVLPDGYVEALSWIAHKKDIPVHLDGARIWNAATALNQPLSSLVQSVDSISACLSKGLGAPVGSLLVGPQSLIKKARRARKALGGGMRQAGLLAAAGLQALDDFERGMLKGDHQRAHALAQRLAELPGLTVDVDTVDTNIILIQLDNSNTCDASAFAGLLRDRGVLVLPFGPNTIRAVTHRDITDKDIDIAIFAFRDVAARVWANSPHYVLENSIIEPASSLTDSKQRKFILETTIEESIDTKEKEQASKITATTHYYEEASIYGMSVSEQGFCVILKGLICDRFLKVLVTPADPMSDGLDRERCESSEAVTLLQLLQGIDVESYLPKDALSAKFASSSSSSSQNSATSQESASSTGGGSSSNSSPSSSPSSNSASSGSAVDSSKNKRYQLKRVLIDDVSVDRKSFLAKLVGFRKSSSRSASPPVPPSHDQQHPTAVTVNNEEISPNRSATSTEWANVPNADGITLAEEAHTLRLFLASPGGAESPEWNTLTAELSGQTAAAAAPKIKEREVDVKSAFEAIALAIRHRSVIEVRSDLLQNEEISYSLDELATYFPKMLVSEQAAPLPSSYLAGMDGSMTGGGIGIGLEINALQQQQQQKDLQLQQRSEYLQFEIDRLQRQYNEAVRQKNEAKVEAIKRKLESTISASVELAERSRNRLSPQVPIQHQGGYQ